MTFDPNPRQDLVDKGHFVPTKQASPAASRRPWLALDGGQTAPTPATVSVYYGMDGGVTTDATRSLAHTAVTDGNTLYFVKVGTSGQTRGHFVDPKGVYFNENDLVKDSRTTGRSRYEFARVTETVFTDYVSYLATRKVSLLRKAERDYLNG